MVGYVVQDDIFSGTLTIRENLVLKQEFLSKIRWKIYQKFPPAEAKLCTVQMLVDFSYNHREAVKKISIRDNINYLY